MQLLNIICHCQYFHKGRRKVLTEKEREVYDLLLSNKLNLVTTYAWFLVLLLPPHIKERLKKREISYGKAIHLGFVWRKMTSRRGGDEIMDQMRAIIGGLEWKNTNHTI